MSERITATEAVRNFSDVLNRVRYQGRTFLILRNGEEVGVLSPVSQQPRTTFRELVRKVRKLGLPDEDFASDLESIRREGSKPPEDPWASS